MALEGLISKKATLHAQHTFFVYFFALMAASIAHVVTDVTKFSCCSSNKKICICFCVYLFATRATRLQLQKDAQKKL